MENPIRTGGNIGYYGVAYGKITKRVQEVPEGYKEVSEAELKSAAIEFQKLPVKNTYVSKGNEKYPYQIFLESLTGDLAGIDRVETDNGVKMKVTLTSGEGDTLKKGEIGVDFYSKYTEFLLNSLCALSNKQGVTLRPFQFKSEQLYNGKQYYITGISVYEYLEDKPLKKPYENDDLPPVEEMVDNKGKKVISRVNRIDFLYEQAVKHLSTILATKAAKKQGTGMKRELPSETINRMFSGKGTSEKTAQSTDIISEYGLDEDLPF